jgi:two-component system, cell cycle response regulator DivK
MKRGQLQRPASRTLVRPLVLVVDDNPDNREMYMEYLCFAGFRVVGAENGQSAVELARKRRPSVILMDLSLPGMDGWEATRILKSDPRTRGIHIVAVTGHAEPACHARAMLVGCDLFVAKPSLPEEIAAYVRDILARATAVGHSSRG